MWLIGGFRSKSTARAGEHLQRACDTCQQVTDHRPVTVRDNVHVFFIDVVRSEQRGYQCAGCGEVVDEARALTERAATGIETLEPGAGAPAARRRLGAAVADGRPHAPAPGEGAAAADVLQAIHATVAARPRVDDPGGIRTARHRPKAGAVDDAQVERELAALKAKRPR